MSRTTPDALKGLYTALGGDAAEVADLMQTPDVIDALAGVAGGGSGGGFAFKVEAVESNVTPNSFTAELIDVTLDDILANAPKGSVTAVVTVIYQQQPETVIQIPMAYFRSAAKLAGGSVLYPLPQYPGIQERGTLNITEEKVEYTVATAA